MAHRECTPSSGNVFADLGLPKPDDLLAKAELAVKIIAEIQRRLRGRHAEHELRHLARVPYTPLAPSWLRWATRPSRFASTKTIRVSRRISSAPSPRNSARVTSCSSTARSS